MTTFKRIILLLLKEIDEVDLINCIDNIDTMKPIFINEFTLNKLSLYLNDIKSLYTAKSMCGFKFKMNNIVIKIYLSRAYNSNYVYVNYTASCYSTSFHKSFSKDELKEIIFRIRVIKL